MSTVHESVLDAIRSVLPLNDLPRLLWWVGTVRPDALWMVEEIGCGLADAMATEGEVFAGALEKWIEALALADTNRRASGEPLGPPPIWAFWMLFTRRERPESPLSALLRAEVGYPAATGQVHRPTVGEREGTA